MADRPPMVPIPIDTFVRIVALPLDSVGVHLVVEATRHKPRHRKGDPVDFRAPITVCGFPGYVATDRKRVACQECARGYPEASAAAVRACRALLALGNRQAQGGAVRPGQGYVVGEEGPEIFRPQGGGHVTGRS